MSIQDPLELDGRPLKVTKAMDKKELTEGQQKKKDRRRLYLILEGVS